MSGLVHADAVDYYLTKETMWESLKNLIIAECEACWIVNGVIVQKPGISLEKKVNNDSNECNQETVGKLF